jgi:hypothetical protein
MLVIHAMPHKHGLRVNFALCHAQGLGRDYHQMRLAKELLFQVEHRLGLYPRKGGILVDALINQQLFSQLAGNHGGGRIKHPIDRPLEAQPLHGPLDLPAQPNLIDAPHNA